MKHGHAEKICRKHVKQSPRYIRWLKRQTSKLWRRAASRFLDDAPVKRPTRGWSD